MMWNRIGKERDKMGQVTHVFLHILPYTGIRIERVQFAIFNEISPFDFTS